MIKYLGFILGFFILTPVMYQAVRDGRHNLHMLLVGEEPGRYRLTFDNDFALVASLIGFSLMVLNYIVLSVLERRKSAKTCDDC